jgi:hypothetical protein
MEDIMQPNSIVNGNEKEFLRIRFNRPLLIVVFLAFSILTVVAFTTQGVTIFETQFRTLGGIQVFVDLLIACLLFSVWMYNDSKANGRRFVPWFILTLLIGSIGPLLYLITMKGDDSKRA